MINDIFENFIAKYLAKFSCKMIDNGKDDIIKYDDLNDSLNVYVHVNPFIYTGALKILRKSNKNLETP
jgi:hypothetical protein